MTEENRIHANYRGLADGKGERNQPENAVSATQHELMELAPGELWAHRVSQRVDRVGGNQGEFTVAGAEDPAAGDGGERDFTLAEAGSPEEVTDNVELPKRIQEGVTTRFEVTDRNLDYDGEFGYPTPT
ncbi:MAG: hypothetical protein ACOY94_25290 [Bacillota bacterium]